jgi:undecaprenyl diphosphate synthase
MSQGEQLQEYYGKIPRHIAIIMDGNGRWANKRLLPRVAGHRAGVESVRTIVQRCGELGVQVLTLFAFSSENWRRPEEEVGLLMELFIMALQRETKKLHERNVRLKVIGDLSRFSEKLRAEINRAEELTRDNDGLFLAVAANYGGRWDVTQAVQGIAARVERGEIKSADISEEMISDQLSLAGQPEPDLFIRTGGEQRISNFLMWQLAYSELYFTDTLWPDFDQAELDKAIEWFAGRQRRFGRTGEQVEQIKRA